MRRKAPSGTLEVLDRENAELKKLVYWFRVGLLISARITRQLKPTNMTTPAERIKGRLHLLASKRNKHRTYKHNNRTDEAPTDIFLEDDATDDDSKERAHAFDRNDIGYEEQCERVLQRALPTALAVPESAA
jgi:hypothetical protein